MPSKPETLRVPDSEMPDQTAPFIHGLQRCDQELASADKTLRNGHPGAEGLAMAIQDWSAEKRMLYDEFLQAKQARFRPSGFTVSRRSIKRQLFDFQRDIEIWAIKKGKSALWADCGLGKTICELEFARHVHKHTQGDILIIAPLAVTLQTVREGEKFNYPVNLCRTQADIQKGINITNYEKLHNFSSDLAGVILDESSILKHYDSKTRNALMEFSRAIPYRLAASATPAPNDYQELGNHSEFLGIMTRQEMLSMFFVHDGGDTGQWRLKGHAQEEFWKWLASWAVMIRKPSDLGYEDGAFILPPLERHQHVVPSEWNDAIAYETGTLFPVEAGTLRERQAARRHSIMARVKVAADLANASKEQWLIWCNLNDESTELTDSIRDSIEVRGPDPDEWKEKAVLDFTAGKHRALISKPSMFGYGLNLQNCHNIAFVGLSDSFEQLYQATRRSWRFGQKYPVHVHIITSEAEGAVVKNIERKEAQAEQLAAGMVEHMRNIMIAEIRETEKESVEYQTRTEEGNGWKLHLGDSCEVMRVIPSESVHYSIYSPPFASMYTYSATERDLGNCAGVDEFLEHYEFIVREMYRIIMPGRLTSFHCMDIPATKEHDGFMGLWDFPAELRALHEKCLTCGQGKRQHLRGKACSKYEGWIFHSRCMIWKDPLIAATRTHAHGLSHKQMVKDSTMSRHGIADMLITMRKPGENPEPISHGSGLDRWIGEGEGPKGEFNRDPAKNKQSHLIWQRYASPVWMDIDPSDTLQYQSAREAEDERHVCPLQLQVIERGMELWSEVGDTVFDPFAGIGSTPYVAVRAKRRGLGVELKESYFRQAVKNLKNAEGMLYQGTLLEGMDDGTRTETSAE